MSAQSNRRLHREFWPLVVTGLLIAGPAFAGEQKGDTSKSTVSQPAQQHAAQKNSQKPTAKKPTAQGAAKTHTEAKPTLKKVSSNVTPHNQPKYDTLPMRRVAQAKGGAASEGFDRRLLDDGTFWHEQGSFVTWQQTGVASWYGGPRWQGKQTTSGERYDQNKLTAAHATLPIGTKVRVVRTDGHGSVIVTINDRPGSRTRIIDLSRAAAKELGILSDGVAMVTLQPL